VVAKIIAQRARYHDTEKAYLVGIIHDIGEVFLSYYHKERFQKIIELKKGEPYKFYDAEAEFFGTTHCEIGLCIARQWNFPADYSEIIALHHTPEKATIDPTLAAIINLADYFCAVRRLDYGGREWVSFNLAEEKAWEILKNYAPHLHDLDVERFCYELDDRVEEISELVKSIFDGLASE
jgi:HD-like signal output (HDOD) protein